MVCDINICHHITQMARATLPSECTITDITISMVILSMKCSGRSPWVNPSGSWQTWGVSNNVWLVKCTSLRWRHNGRDGVWNHQPHDCLLNCLVRRRAKKTSKLRVTGLCVGNSLGTGEFPAQMASNAKNVSTWWRHHVSKSYSTSMF